MNLLADEGVERQIVERLRQDGHVVDYIAELEPGIDDEVILERANAARALLITADKDFGELVFRQRLVHWIAKVLVLWFGRTPSIRPVLWWLHGRSPAILCSVKANAHQQEKQFIPQIALGKTNLRRSLHIRAEYYALSPFMEDYMKFLNRLFGKKSKKTDKLQNAPKPDVKPLYGATAQPLSEVYSERDLNPDFKTRLREKLAQNSELAAIFRDIDYSAEHESIERVYLKIVDNSEFILAMTLALMSWGAYRAYPELRGSDIYVPFEMAVLRKVGPKATPQIISELGVFLRFDKQGGYKWGASKLCKLLGEFKSKEALDILVRISAISSNYVSFNECRVAAIYALAEIGDLSAISSLVKIQNQSDAATKQQIIQYALTESLSRLGLSKNQEEYGVVFIKEYVDQESTSTYRVYRADTATSAKSFLSEIPLTQASTYWVVETPQGNFIRNKDDIYQK